MQALDDKHLDTLTSMSNLATTYINQARWKEAEELVLQVVQSRKQTLGEEHPDTLHSMYLLSAVLFGQGRQEEDEALNRQLLEIRTRVQGLDHPDTLTAMNNLAVIARNQGRLLEAATLGKQVLDGRKRLLGAEHMDTLVSTGSLVMLYQKQGRILEAEELGTQLLETRKRVLGHEHFHTLRSMHSLAHIWKLQGRDRKAVDAMTHCAKLKARVFGPDHPQTKASIESLKEWQLDSTIDIYLQCLLPSTKHIRVLSLNPPEGDGQEISYSMHAMSLEDQGREYDALSYCWGGSDRNSHMTINGHRFPITESLANALRTLRSAARNFIWIDQICIDQSDGIEKADQVRLMTQIYSSCRICFCYLGEEDDRTHTALIKAAYLNSQDNDVPVLLKAPVQLPLDFTKDENLIATEDDGIALYQLFNRSYFSRRWIIQEICVSKLTVAVCGRYQFSMIHLLRAHDLQVRAWLEQGKFDHLALSTRVFGNTSTMWKLNAAWKDDVSIFPLHLPNLLDLTGQFQSTDPRDTFYSVLGIAKDVDDFPTVDYTRNLEDVNLDFTKVLISKGYGWLCLSRASGSPSRDLSSWVPDWSRSTTHRLGNPLNLLLGAPSAGTHAVMLNRSDVFTLDPDGQKLQVKIAALEQVPAVTHPGNSDTSNLPMLIVRLRAAYHLINPGSEAFENDRPFLKRIASILMPLWPGFDGDVETMAEVLSYFSRNPDSIAVFQNSQARGASSQDLESNALGLGFTDIWTNAEIVLTQSKKLCLVPLNTKAGATIAVVEESQPAILLHDRGGNTYAYVGPVSLEVAPASGSSEEGAPDESPEGFQVPLEPRFVTLV